MGIFKDFMDIVKDVGDAVAVANFHKKQYKSLHDRSQEGTLQFPHIISRGLGDLDTAQMVCKASERQMATFIQISMSMSPTLWIEDGTSAVDYIKQFHQNLSDVKPTKMGRHTLQAIMNEGYQTFLEENLGVLIATTTLNDKTSRVVVENTKQLRDLMESINKNILNQPVDSFMINHKKGRALYEAQSDPLKRQQELEDLALQDWQKMEDRQQKDAHHQDTMNMKRAELGSKNAIAAAQMRQREREMDQARTQHATDVELQKARMKQSMRKDLDVTLNKNMLQDNDAKKANELVSTLVHVRIQMLSKETKEFVGYQDFVLGVKATMHLVSSEEMTDNLLMAYRGNDEVFNFLRWTTGEISFFKDFILNLSQAKQDVLQRSAGASSLWISTKRARALSKLYNRVHSSKSILPNTTIVVTQEEVDYMREHHNVNFSDIRVVNKVMDVLFLIDFIIVDMAQQICHFKFEAADDWETVSFSGLERENSRDERKFKEMLKALNR